MVDFVISHEALRSLANATEVRSRIEDSITYRIG
jgi:hypothetical protein